MNTGNSLNKPVGLVRPTKTFKPHKVLSGRVFCEKIPIFPKTGMINGNIILYVLSFWWGCESGDSGGNFTPGIKFLLQFKHLLIRIPFKC